MVSAAEVSRPAKGGHYVQQAGTFGALSSDALLEVLLEELRSSAVGQLRGVLVVVSATVAGEGVVAAWIGEDSRMGCPRALR